MDTRDRRRIRLFRKTGSWSYLSSLTPGTYPAGTASVHWLTGEDDWAGLEGTGSGRAAVHLLLLSDRKRRPRGCSEGGCSDIYRVWVGQNG